MEPKHFTKLGLKDDPTYGMGKVSVSWHADSSLQVALPRSHPHLPIPIPAPIPSPSPSPSPLPSHLHPHPHPRVSQDFSTIGVYHVIEGGHNHLQSHRHHQRQSNDGCDWRIALRLSPELQRSSAKLSEVPPVVLPTDDGDAYYLFGDFNHDKQHAVCNLGDGDGIW